MNNAVSARNFALDKSEQENDWQTDSSEDQTPLLMRYLAIVLRRRWILLGSVVLAVALGLIATLLMTPKYTATATIEIARDGQRVVDIKGVDSESNAGDLEFYQTQYGLLKSRALGERVATDLRLDQNPDFFEMYGVKDGGGMSIFNASKPAPSNVAANRQAKIKLAGALLLGSIQITPERASRLVRVSFISPDPRLAATVANAWTDHFIRSNLERRFDATAYARKFLEDRLEQLRQRLEQSEKLLVAYASTQKIINLPSATPTKDGTSSERSLTAEDLSTLNEALTVATSDMIRARSRLPNAGSSSESVANGTIQALRQKRAEIAADYQRLLVQFEPQYPAAQALASQVSQLDKAISREEARVQSSLAADFRSSSDRVSALQSRVDALKSGFLDERRRSIQYNIYQREVDTNRQLYDGLLQRYKEIGIAGGVGTNNVAIVDAADVPTGTSSPRLFFNLILSMLAGLVIGAAAALAMEQIDDTISDPGDVQRLLRLPLLGTIPTADTDSPILELADRKSPIVEAYVSVQTNLEFSTSHGAPKTMSVTSTRPAEGKSTTAFAIASALARSTQRKVILVDGDMRSPSVHRMVGFSNAAGLSNFLSGNDDLTSLVHVSPPGTPSFMSAGPPPPNAAELLTGNRLRTLLEALLKTYDHVVIDAPPVMGLADAPLIAGQVEAMIFAVESHGVRRSVASVALGRLRSANANIIGIVLTKFDNKRAFGYNYDYGYGYGQRSTSES
jgi:polysaccharide biosynthesis transport protein